MSADMSHLLKEKSRTGAHVIGAAINAIAFYECQDYDTAFRILKEAVDRHNQACRDYFNFLTQKESANVDRPTAA